MPFTFEQTRREPATKPSTTQTTPDWQSISVDALQQQQLKAALQQHVTATPTSAQNHSITQTNYQFIDALLAKPLIERRTLAPLLERLFDEQMRIYAQADIPTSLRKRQYINQSGLVISPDHCVTTLKDTLRVGTFIKGIDTAIRCQLQRQDSLTIAYPACGPFAPLLLPLLSYYHRQNLFSPQQLRITLIDIQEGATASLQALIHAHGISEYIDAVSCEDACLFKTEQPFDMVIIEAMQHGFSREGHLRIAEHFSALLKEDGIFIPKSIVVQAWLNNAQREYVEQWQAQNPPADIRDERIFLGDVLVIDKDLARKMQPTVVDSHTQLLPCNRLQVPVFDRDCAQTLLLSSRICVFDEYWLNEYESGITHPLPDLNICVDFTPKVPEAGDVLVNSGDFLQFFYCLNGLPGFFAIKDESHNNSAEVSHD